MKDFLTPSTGKIVSYPDHFATLKPYLIEVTGDVPCVDCVVKQPEQDEQVPLATESVVIQEPAKKPRVHRVAE